MTDSTSGAERAGSPIRATTTSGAGAGARGPAATGTGTGTSTTTTTGERAQPAPGRGGPGAGASRATSGGGTGRIVAALVLGLVVGALGAAGIMMMNDDDAEATDPFAGLIDPQGYQAVILANDRVYFGKITAAGADFYELDDAFFLREAAAAEGEEAAQTTRALLPINRELHGPENSMLIRRDEVVLVEDLAEDSPILREIERQIAAR